MVDKDHFMSMAYFKKQAFTGSLKGMNYRVVKEEEGEEENKKTYFLVTIWPGPFCYASTPDEKKDTKRFPYSVEGKDQVVDYLNERYMKDKEKWDAITYFA